MQGSMRRVLAPVCGSLVSIAAAVVLAGICTDAQAYGNKGVLRLQLGAVNQFILDGTSTVQSLSAAGKGSCELVSTGASLARLTGTVGSLDAPVGFGPTSIGVFDGPKGVPCYRVSKYAGETLTFALGGYFTGGPANAFDRLELDIEVKGDAELLLTTHLLDPATGQKANWALKTYTLRTGSKIIPGESGPQIFNCSARSDSGPDSGALDNCRWIVNGVGQAFTIVPMSGEFSLEGGGDWGSAAPDNNSLIHLTNVEVGSLACGGNTNPRDIGDGAAGAQCQVASPPEGSGGQCDVYYAFRDITGDTKGCEFIKGPDNQLAASMTITFPPEPRTDLYNVPPTFFEFPGRATLFQPDICTGTIATDAGGNPVSPPAIFPYPVDDANDAVPFNNFIDWACILEHSIEYLGDDSMQVSQTILFWGDPAAVRF